jgi:hypothetical protein
MLYQLSYASPIPPQISVSQPDAPKQRRTMATNQKTSTLAKGSQLCAKEAFLEAFQRALRGTFGAISRTSRLFSAYLQRFPEEDPPSGSSHTLEGQKRSVGRRSTWSGGPSITETRKPRATAGGTAILAALGGGLLALAASTGLAQSHGPAQLSAAPAQNVPAQLPDAPVSALGSIYGTVTDPAGNLIAGARVTLAGGALRQTATTGEDGFFKFNDLPAGSFRLTIAAKGFASWTGPEIVLTAGRYYDVPDISLRIAPANSDVEVVLTRHELADLQIKEQERQRILGVIPNFFTSYVWRAVPITAGQKFRLAARSSIDPVTFGIDAATAGVEQATDSFRGYGQGGEGYAKRFGAAYGDDAIGTMLGGAVFPSLLRQDPRYFYKGTGSIRARTLYAVSTVVICRGDNGRRQPNYSNILGNLAAAGISNLYYPASNRTGAGVTIDNALIGTAEGAFSALLQEFLFKKMIRGVQQAPSPRP